MLHRGVHLLRQLTAASFVHSKSHSWLCPLHFRQLKKQLQSSACVCHVAQNAPALNRGFGAEAISESDSDLDSVETTEQYAAVLPEVSRKAQLFEDDVHPIRDNHIARPVWVILVRLRGAGHEAYVVGGAVRDILLGKRPKDVDVLTTAQPFQVKRLFPRCFIYGKRHPIAEVQLDGYKVEVSCFLTNSDESKVPCDASVIMHSRKDKRRGSAPYVRRSATWREARLLNVANRDFTVNALLYDPFARILYDYVDAMSDIRDGLVRTVGDPHVKFQDDPVRIIRGMRIAARNGLTIDAETSSAMRENVDLITSVSKGRLVHESQALLAYGAAAASLELLWRYDILPIMFPQHSDYLRAKKYPKLPKKPRKEPLFGLLKELDARVHVGAPVSNAVWTCIMAVPLISQRIKALGPAIKKQRAAVDSYAVDDEQVEKADVGSEEEGGEVGKRKKRKKKKPTTAKAKFEARAASGKVEALDVYDLAVKEVMVELGFKGSMFDRPALLQKCTHLLLTLPRNPEKFATNNTKSLKELMSEDDEEAMYQHNFDDDFFGISKSSAEERLVFEVLASSEYTWSKLTGLKPLRT